ncbi:hypothetical protein [Nocardioides sp. L-11A]|uniref:hypothetical protein n=1 Tax=Nocardioides sp. L-11A TaxID=3043848 RepID=UPI00249C4EE1|nr:hypothetical protein QJ852_15270 [Nocardioides sp. L-11A]
MVSRGPTLLHAQAADVREAGRREMIEQASRKERAMMGPVVVFLVLPTTALFAYSPTKVEREGVCDWPYDVPRGGRMASDIERQQAAARALSDPAVQAQLIAATRRLADQEYMAAVRRSMQDVANLMADREFWASYRRSVVSMMSTLSSAEFWESYRRSVVATMSLFSDPKFWESFREQMMTATRVVSSPDFAAALQRQVAALSATNQMYADAVRQSLEGISQQMADPTVSAAIRQRLAAAWEEQQASTSGHDGPLPLMLFANLVFTCVLLWCLGYFLGEANRTGEDLLEANRFEVASSVGFALTIAFGARNAVLRGGKYLGM